MSLWTKSIDSIGWSDVEAFCQLGQREGLRLDYKGSIPNELSKLVAAFANTQGGLILLGIEADQIKNEPILPIEGMPAEKGLDERILAKCRDNIFPPVRPQISPVLSNPQNPNKVVIVIRVDASPEAPHADDKGRVFTRTGNQKHPYDHAHIDRIRALLERRGRIEEERESLIRGDRERAMRRLERERAGLRMELKGQAVVFREAHYGRPGSGTPPDLPVRWASVIPLYPWEKVCDLRACLNAVQHRSGMPRDEVQCVPGGVYARHSAIRENQQMEVGCSIISTVGHVFSMEVARETINLIKLGVLRHLHLSQASEQNCYICYENSVYFMNQLLQIAQFFYQQDGVERPGFLQITLGFEDVLNFQMYQQKTHHLTGKPFIDVSFKASIVVALDEFMGDTKKCSDQLLHETRLGFDLLLPERE